MDHILTMSSVYDCAVLMKITLVSDVLLIIMNLP